MIGWWICLIIFLGLFLFPLHPTASVIQRHKA